jgi:hypothetical protein
MPSGGANTSGPLPVACCTPSPETSLAGRPDQQDVGLCELDIVVLELHFSPEGSAARQAEAFAHPRQPCGRAEACPSSIPITCHCASRRTLLDDFSTSAAIRSSQCPLLRERPARPAKTASRPTLQIDGRKKLLASFRLCPECSQQAACHHRHVRLVHAPRRHTFVPSFYHHADSMRL